MGLGFQREPLKLLCMIICNSERYARWMPHALTQAQKAKRIKCATKLLSEFDRDDLRRLFEIVTGDETWVRYCEPVSKKVMCGKRTGPTSDPSTLSGFEGNVLYIFRLLWSSVPVLCLQMLNKPRLNIHH